jgi:hypothetical protein
MIELIFTFDIEEEYLFQCLDCFFELVSMISTHAFARWSLDRSRFDVKLRSCGGDITRGLTV